jgi:hypothetical protein
MQRADSALPINISKQRETELVMIKKLLIAAAMAMAVGFGAPAPAEAASAKVRIYLGVPHYSYRIGPDYEYRRGYGWYRPAKRKISCERARSVVRNHGYRNVRTVECRGATYTFRGVRNGKRFVLYVNARSGGMWRG